MSFLSTIAKIFSGVQKVTSIVAPIIQPLELIPGVGTVAGTIFNTVVSIESLVTSSGTGAQKKAAATTIVNAIHPGLDQNSLSTSIDAIVKSLNDLEAAFAKVPTVPPTA